MNRLPVHLVFLIAKGYRILARRIKTPFVEIDIVARRRVEDMTRICHVAESRKS